MYEGEKLGQKQNAGTTGEMEKGFLSDTPQSIFALKPVSGSAAKFSKPYTTNTRLASRYFVHCCPGVTHQIKLLS